MTLGHLSIEYLFTSSIHIFMYVCFSSSSLVSMYAWDRFVDTMSCDKHYLFPLVVGWHVSSQRL